MPMKRKKTPSRWSLIVPDEQAGDRPFDARPYGRVRMNEGMAREALRILRDEKDRLIRTKHSGAGDKSSQASLRNTEKLLNNLMGMMDEKGWLD